MFIANPDRYKIFSADFATPAKYRTVTTMQKVELAEGRDNPDLFECKTTGLLRR